jgi:hypothetical protein
MVTVLRQGARRKHGNCYTFYGNRQAVKLLVKRKDRKLWANQLRSVVYKMAANLFKDSS